MNSDSCPTAYNFQKNSNWFTTDNCNDSCDTNATCSKCVLSGSTDNYYACIQKANVSGQTNTAGTVYSTLSGGNHGAYDIRKS